MTTRGTPYGYRDGVYTFPGDGYQLVLSGVRRNRYRGIDCDAELWTQDGSGLLGTERGDITQNRFRGGLAAQAAKRNSGDTLTIENFIVAAYVALRDDPNVVTTAPPPTFHPVDQFLRGVQPPGPQVVAGLLERGCLYAFASRPKVGKTIMLSNLAVAVAKGHEWLDRQVAPGRVYFFQLEDSDRTLKRRLERMLGPDSTADLGKLLLLVVVEDHHVPGYFTLFPTYHTSLL